MHRFRHPLLQRGLALVVVAGVFAGVAQAMEARPADRYAAWLRAQAEGEARALVDVALRHTILPPAPTPGEFLAGYAAAQARVTHTSTGAFFGYDDLTFMQALGRLEVRLAGLSAPPSPVAVTAAVVAAPVLPLGGAALPLLRAARIAPPVRPAPVRARVAPGPLPRLLYGVSAAQPMGP